MKRRPKLSLSPDDQVDKRQPAGFEDTASTASEAGPEAENPLHEKPRARNVPPKPRIDAVPASAEIDRKKLVKVLVVLTVSALSLYLLKRRFF